MAVKSPFTPKEYGVLVLRKQRVFSRSAIIDHLWDFEEPEEDTIKSHIKGLTETESSRSAY